MGRVVHSPGNRPAPGGGGGAGAARGRGAGRATHGSGDGGGLRVGGRGAVALEQDGRYLGQLVDAVVEPGVAVSPVVVEVVHHGQGEFRARDGESNGVSDPPVAALGGGMLPAILVARLVFRPRAPDAPLLVERADVPEPVDEVVADAGRGFAEHVVDEVIEVVGGAVHVAPVRR